MSDTITTSLGTSSSGTSSQCPSLPPKTEIRPASLTRTDLTRTVLSIILIVGLILGCFWVLKPFLLAALWAALIVIPTWPIMLKLKDIFGGRRVLAVTAMTIFLILVVLVPIWMALVTILEQREVLHSWIVSASVNPFPAPPVWLGELPLVGTTLVERWRDLANSEVEVAVQRAAPYLNKMLAWFMSTIQGAGILLVHFLLTMILTVVLLMRGEVFANGIRRFAVRLAGDRGEQVTILAAKAVRAVAMGVVVTALAQAALSAVALLVVGIPYAVLLAAVVFVLAVIQIGAGPVLIPVTVWLFWSGQIWWGSLFAVVTVAILSIDNFMRPILIKRGADLPLLLIFAGVIGGLFAFGIIGLFVGPIILAVSYTLISAWIDELRDTA